MSMPLFFYSIGKHSFPALFALRFLATIRWSIFRSLQIFTVLLCFGAAMSMWTELKAFWFTILSQLSGSKHYRLRSRGLTTTQARTRILRDKISPRLRWHILKRDCYTCTKCGRRPPRVTLEVDHLIPLA